MSRHDVTRFLDPAGKVKQWPTKHSDKALVIAYLATKFNDTASYTEAEVNELLKQWHTFSDWPLLRRELYDRGYLDRTPDGSSYRRTAKPTTESAPLTITPIQPSELEELADVAARTYADAFGADMTPESLRKILETTRSAAYFKAALATSRILVAKQAGKIVGYVQFGEVKIPEAPADPADRELGRLYVDTHLQGQGIGQQLLDAALAAPEMTAAPNLYLQVWAQNAKAVALYQSRGFTAAGVTHFTLSDGTLAEDAIMVRRQKS